MGKYHQEVRKARMRGYVLDATLPSISFSWRAETGAICTLPVEPAAATRTARQEFLKYHQKIMEKFSIGSGSLTSPTCLRLKQIETANPSVSCHVAQDGLPTG